MEEIERLNLDYYEHYLSVLYAQVEDFDDALEK